MNRARAVTAVALALATWVATAASQTTPPQPYALKRESSFQTGCFGPCLCPVVSHPMAGTFSLRLASVDPLFTRYDVLDVRWYLLDASQNLSIVGSGTYRVGGEFAVQHQMILDLSVGGRPAQRFDSGLVPGGGFPDIDIRLSQHADSPCVDTVLVVRAGPVSSGHIGWHGGRRGAENSALDPRRVLD